MPTREQLHALIDSLPEPQLPTARVVVDEDEPSLNGAGEDSNGAVSSTARGARNFLISVADGTSGLDLDSLRTVRDRAWR
jgi:hypothetical protein